MKTTAVSLPRLTLPSSSGLTARLGDFVTLMKPRVMLLAVFTALVGLMIAPGHLDPLHAAIAIMAIAAGGGAAGVLNMWYEADIDAAMTRTAKRPIPRGKISRAEALLFGTALAGGAVATLGFALNVVAFFVITLACHGELSRSRPAAQHLTAFYMWMSAGGVIGGIFAGLIARAFSVASSVCRCVRTAGHGRRHGESSPQRGGHACAH